MVPETFKPAAEAQKNQLAKIPLQPPDRIEGRFAAAERLPGGWYQQGNDSMVSMGGAGLASGGLGRMQLHPRDSFDSNFSAQTSTHSIYMPRRVESIMDEENQKKYAMAQATQRAGGGTYATAPPTGQIYEMDEIELRKGGWKDSVESLADDQNRPDHRRISSLGSMGGTPGDGSPLDTGLRIPRPVSTAHTHRSGRSPLGRVSLIRSVSSDGEAIEQENQRVRTPEISPGQSPKKSGQPER